MDQIDEKSSLSRMRDLLLTIHDACARFHLVSLKRQLDAAEGHLAENRPIDVAILGQFKAGKSSFINSLIGGNVLPVGVIPVTTAITRLQYGDVERAVIRHFDGSTTETQLDGIAAFTSEAGNPGNEKDVDIVDIELPSLERYPGIRLVDTPGLGSVFQYHKATSENWLPEVGTALLAVSADRPLSEHDLALIRELMSHTPKIILLLTKADLLSPDQQQEVVHFFKQTLHRELNHEFPIYLYSLRHDTERFKHLVEAEILGQLSANRDLEFRQILLYKTRSLAKSCLGYLEIARKAALQADQDREGLQRQILDEKVNEEFMREDLGRISRDCRLQTRPLIKIRLDRFWEPLARDVIDKLEQALPSWKGNLWTLTRRFEAWMSETMTAEMQRISRIEHPHFFGTLKKAHAGFSRSLEAFRIFLNENIKKVLGVELAEMDWEIDVVEPDRPDIISTKSFDIHLDLIWFLIPMFIFRRFFERHFINGIPRDAEINLSRLAAQWEKRINAAIEAMQKQAIGYVQEELSTLETLLSKVEGRSEEIRQLMAKIQKQSEQSGISIGQR